MHKHKKILNIYMDAELALLTYNAHPYFSLKFVQKSMHSTWQNMVCIFLSSQGRSLYSEKIWIRKEEKKWNSHYHTSFPTRLSHNLSLIFLIYFLPCFHSNQDYSHFTSMYKSRYTGHTCACGIVLKQKYIPISKAFCFHTLPVAF